MTIPLLPMAARIRALLALLIVASLLLACGSALPKRARQVLEEEIAELAGADVEFEIASMVKGRLQEERSLADALSGQEFPNGSCPPDRGNKLMWCVVLEEPIEAADGATYRRFLVQILGTSWNVLPLSEDQAEVFLCYRCGNWDAGQ